MSGHLPRGRSVPQVGVVFAIANLFLSAAMASYKKQTIRTDKVAAKWGGSNVGASDGIPG